MKFKTKPLNHEFYFSAFDFARPMMEDIDENYDTLMMTFINLVTETLLQKAKTYDVEDFSQQLDRAIHTLNGISQEHYARKFPQFLTDPTVTSSVVHQGRNRLN